MARLSRPPTRSRAATSSPRRDEIRAVAGKVFAEQGFASTTMRDVGDASGTGAGSLYHHFTSKNDILLELLEAFFADIIRDLTAAISQEQDPLANLTDMIRMAIGYVVDRRDESQILLNDYPYVVSSDGFESVVGLIRESTEIWLRALKQARAAGQMCEDADVRIVFASLMGSIFSSLRFFDPRGRVAREVYIDAMTTQLVDGLRRR